MTFGAESLQGRQKPFRPWPWSIPIRAGPRVICRPSGLMRILLPLSPAMNRVGLLSVVPAGLGVAHRLGRWSTTAPGDLLETYSCGQRGEMTAALQIEAPSPRPSPVRRERGSVAETSSTSHAPFPVTSIPDVPRVTRTECPPCPPAVPSPVGRERVRVRGQQRAPFRAPPVSSEEAVGKDGLPTGEGGEPATPHCFAETAPNRS